MNNPDYKPNVNSLRDYIYIFKKLMLNQRENFSKLNLAKTTLTLIKSPHSICLKMMKYFSETIYANSIKLRKLKIKNLNK